MKANVRRTSLSLVQLKEALCEDFIGSVLVSPNITEYLEGQCSKAKRTFLIYRANIVIYPNLPNSFLVFIKTFLSGRKRICAWSLLQERARAKLLRQRYVAKGNFSEEFDALHEYLTSLVKRQCAQHHSRQLRHLIKLCDFP